MPTAKSHHNHHNRRGSSVGEKNKKGRLTEKSLSFHGGSTVGNNVGEMLLRRPRTVPELLSVRIPADRGSPEVEARPPKLTKLLLNVTIQRSLGPVQVLISLESKVEDLIAAALGQYKKEGRRPILPSYDAAGFDLHYSKFSLESLPREEKLMTLGSRNFFLCPKRSGTEEDDGTTPSASCSKEAGKAAKTSPWLKFMEFLR